jgi:hypothetical protein
MEIEKGKILIAVREKIKKLLSLDKKEKLLSSRGTAICKKMNVKNLKKIRQIEAKLKEKPENAELKVKLAKLKAKNETIKALIACFSDFDANINSEIGWLTNESGSLAKPEVAKKSAKEEAQCIARQKDLVIELRKQADNLKPRQKPKQIAAKVEAKPGVKTFQK